MVGGNIRFVMISTIIVVFLIPDVSSLRSSTKCFGEYFNDVVCGERNSTIDIKNVTFGVSECNSDPEKCCPEREVCVYPANVNNTWYIAITRGCQGKPQCFNVIATRLSAYDCNSAASVATDFVTIYYECVTDDNIIVTTIPTTSASPMNTTSSPGDRMGKGNSGAIAGAVVGVLIVLAILCVVGFILYRRKKKKDDLSWAAEDNNAYVSGPRHGPESIHVVNGLESTTNKNISGYSGLESSTNQNAPGYLEIEESYASLNENKMLPDIRGQPSAKSQDSYFYPEDEFDDVDDDDDDPPPAESHQYQDPSGLASNQNNPPGVSKDSGKVPKYAKVMKNQPKGTENKDAQGEVYYSPVDSGKNNPKEGMAPSRPSGANSMYDTALPVQGNDMQDSDTVMKNNSVYMTIDD